jgi:hypothetical protein
MLKLLALSIAFLQMAVHAADHRGAQFIAITNFANFKESNGELISPIIETAIPFDQLVPSWNSANPLTIKIAAVYPDGPTKFYNLGNWSPGERHSVTNQTDTHGDVDTDTLKLKQPATKIQISISRKDAKFVGVSLRDSKYKAEPLEPRRSAWGKSVVVKPRSQLDYPEGARNWCSPTSTSMILDFWSEKLSRPELSVGVREAAKAIYDPHWPGTGNWPFNTAFAGSFPGLRAYVTQLTDLSELEAWTEAGFPVATSVSYNLLKGLNKSGSGHLIVAVGFDEKGDIIVNDPGTRLDNVRRTFDRELFRKAWAYSGNTVYLIHPEGAKIPPPTHGHWAAN